MAGYHTQIIVFVICIWLTPSNCHHDGNSKSIGGPIHECSQSSPGYIFQFEVEPSILKTLDELGDLTNHIIDKIGDGVDTMQAHVDKMPRDVMQQEKDRDSMRQELLGHLKDVYTTLVSSWGKLQQVKERYEEDLFSINSRYVCAFATGRSDDERNENVFNDLVSAVKDIKGAHRVSAATLRAVQQELAITTKAILMSSVTAILDTVHVSNNADPAEKSKMFNDTLQIIAPNFFGKLLKKVMERGTDTSKYKKINVDVLQHINEVVDSLYEDMALLQGRCYPCKVLHPLFHNFWRSVSLGSYHRATQDKPLQPDFKKVFTNEEHLSEFILALVASF